MATVQEQLDALESAMQEVRVLASSAHEDAGNAMAVQRNQAKLINAWGEQMNARFNEMNARFSGEMDRMARRMDTLEEKVDRGFATLASGQQAITELLTEMNRDR